MAQRKKSEVEFIQDTFCPQVAVLCSYDAEVVCRKNALTFVELVQPFCRFNGEIKISDASNNLCTISNLRVEIKDINSLPPQPLLAKKLLDESVANGLQSPQNCIEKQVNTNNYNFIANVNTPWFESWRECFIKVAGYPHDHEFLKHFLSCIFVVSTSHLDPLDQFQKLVLQQQQPVVSNRLPKWFFPSQNYKYFVLLHDVQEGEISKAHQVYENLKSTYGSSNCHLLQINSKSSQQIEQQKLNNQTTEFDPWLKYCKYNNLFDSSNLNQSFQKPETPHISIDDESIIDNPLNSKNKNVTSTEAIVNGSMTTKRHGMCLAMSDHDRIKTLISEFLQRGLVPYTERTIKMLNEQIQSKKSILKSFGIPRRIFGGSSTSLSSSRNSTSASLSINSTNNSVTASLNTSAASSAVANCATTEELQLRRLADLSFMFRLYDLAYSSYHTCKKEFTSNINNTSQQSTEVLLAKTLYLAGALEMASLSNFMQNFSGNDPNSLNTSNLNNQSKTYNLQYIDEAILLLLNTCKNNYFATRCALLSTEALKANNLFVKAAYQFISLSSDESDMRSALFLEQAAQCYLAMNMIRKYAFFMSIAGYRFNKAGQRKHSIRVYKHSLDIYENRNWFKAQDHLNFVMSRLNYNLKNLSNALSHINNITNKKKLPQKPSSYNTTEQATFTKIVEFQNETNVLKDLILYCNTSHSLMASDESVALPILSVPIINAQNIKINLLPVDNVKLNLGKYLCINENYPDYLYEPLSFVEKEILNSLNNTSEKPIINLKRSNELKEMWSKFEQSLYMSAYKSMVPIMFKPQVTLLGNYTDNKQMPKVFVDESCVVMLEMKNILKISTIIYETTLLWKFEQEDGNVVTNEGLNEINDIVECSVLNELTLTAFETYKIRFSAIPKRSDGVLTILGLKYRIGLSNQLESSTNDYTTLTGKQLFEIKGKRLNNNQQNIRTIAYDVDNRLNLKIVKKTASLHIEMDKMPEKMLCNQLERVKLYFINKSDTIPVGNIRIASNGISQSNICFNDSNKRVESSLKPNELNTRLTSDYKTNLKPNNGLDSLKSEPLKFKFTHTHKSEESYSTPNTNNLNDSNELVYSLDDVVIQPNEHYSIDMWIRAPEKEGNHILYFMFFYEDANNIKKTPVKKPMSSNSFKYRIIRYELPLKIEQSLTNSNMSIINSQIDSNLIVNLEVANHQHSYNFEFIDLISVSNIWQAKPIESNKKFTNQIATGTFSKSDNVFSLILKAKPVKKTLTKEVYFYRSIFENANEMDQSHKPKENVLFHFINADLKSQLSLNTDSELNYLTINMLWRSVTKHSDSNETIINYGIMPMKIINEQETCTILQEPEQAPSTILDSNITFNNSINDLKKLILAVSNCKSNVRFDYRNKNFCSVQVDVHLKNLSSELNCDLILIAKNPRTYEIEKSYLWLGCNKKYTKLKANSSKTLKFKLGFYSTGTFEIGRIAADTSLKASLFEASCNLNTTLQNTISLDEYLNEVQSDTLSGNSLNPMSQSSQTNETSTLSVFIRNTSNNKYELFKRLNPFTVSISGL